MELTIDPELRALIPPLAADERKLLEESIIRDGVMSPLVLWERGDGPPILIDGHNRYDIANAHGIAWSDVPPVRLRFESKLKAAEWMYDNQLTRRNLQLIDRAKAKLRVEVIRLREENEARASKARSEAAKAQHAVSNPRAGEVMVVSEIINDQKPEPEKHTHKALAAALNTSPDTAQKLLTILEAHEAGEVTDEEIEAIRTKGKSINSVAKKIREKKQRAKREAKRDEAVAKSAAPMPGCLVVGDFREHEAAVPSGSVSLIFTDPPYDRQASKMLPDLGKFAMAKLMDGGSLILYVGQTQIPAALDALRESGLRYWWTIACIHSGRSTVMREYGINAGWKAVLWFVKGTRHDNSVMVNDTMSGGEEKTHHDWQQSQSESEYWIGKLTAADGIVCDPFLGGGTTAAAAQKLGRKWLGFEINPDSAKIIAERLSND